jgi:hypothetical protein
VLPAAWSWTQLTANGAAGAPPARQDATVVWDPADRELLVYGGTDTSASTAMSDLWAYSPAKGAWTQLAAANAAPAGRFGAAGVWDPVDKYLLIVGGQQGTGTGATFFNDVEAYAPISNTWTTLSPQGASGAPTPRSRVGAAWDSTSGRLLLFGGETVECPLTLSSELWAFVPAASSGTWSALAAGGAVGDPPACDGVAAAWDPSAGVLRLFGGMNQGSSPLGNTWEWSPAGGWHFDEARTQPSGRGAAASAWDVQHTHFLVGPGLGLGGDANDTWAYDPSSTTWLAQNVTNSGALPARQMTGMAWDDADGQGLLFGGYASGVGAANDLWSLAPVTSTAPPTPSPTPAAVQKALDVGLVVDRNGNLLVTPQEINAITATGATRVRFAFDLGTSTSWTPTLLNTYGQAITMFENAGIGVIGLVGNGATGDNNQADWTANNDENTGGNGDNPFINSTYISALDTLVSQFHGPPYNVKSWELWNEPNAYTSCSGSVCTGGSYIYPSNFAALLADSYQKIKVTDSITDVTLISGGLFGHSIGGVYSPDNAGASYLSSTYNIGINVIGTWKTIKAQTGSYPLDAVGQHIYVDQSQYSTPATLRAYADWLRATYTQYEGPITSKPTIVTEEGWTTGGTNVAGVTTAQQADNVDAAYWAAKDVSYLPIVTWFQLRDNPAANLFQGLYTATWTAKPALVRYQAQ